MIYNNVIYFIKLARLWHLTLVLCDVECQWSHLRYEKQKRGVKTG